MIVQIDKNVYEMPIGVFNKTVELILKNNSSMYFIYCLVQNGIHILTNDFFNDKESFLKLLKSYVEKGFDVYFVEEGVKYVEQSS